MKAKRFLPLKTKCWCPLLDYKHPIDNDECIEDDVPLSVLRQQIVAQQHSEFEELLNLTETAFPQSNLSVNELRIWTGIDDNCANGTEGVIDDVNQPVEASDEDEDEHDEINGDKCTIEAAEAIKIFDKAIHWTEHNTNSLEHIIFLNNIRDIAVKKSLEAKKKQSTILDFFK